MRGSGVILVILATLLIYSPVKGEEYQVSVTNVNVWVKVVDSSGKPVQGMRKEEFEIFEDGKKVGSECFEEIGFQLPEESVSAPPVTDAREFTGNYPKRFVLFLDLHNSTQIEFERIRPKMDEFLGQIENRNWKVMLVAYLSSGKLGVVSPFTNDFVRIRALLDQAKGNAQRDQRITRNEREINEILSALKPRKDSADTAVEEGQNESGGGEGGDGFSQASGVGSAEEQFFQMAITNAYRQAQQFARQERNSSEHSFGALESFSDYYASNLSSGEHTIILFVSGGINSDPGRRYYDLVSNFVTSQAANVNSAEFNITMPSSTKDINFDLEKQIQRSVGKLNRNNMTLYAINTRGLVSSGPDVTQMDASFSRLDLNIGRDYQDSLSQMAQETGGLSFQNSQNFKVGFDNVLSDLSH